ncbi:MAG TPA: hypothetical protein VJ789_07055 [Burkholderiales bacterium]|nr:hypothetical protein [Burkholderiales bacterium]
MSSHKTDRLARVISGALRVWAVSASVEEQSGAIVVGEDLRIVPEAPHGWMVFRDAQLLGAHAGLLGLLRTLRQELAPNAPAGRLIIGSQSLA